jgi:hypothetical protein
MLDCLPSAQSEFPIGVSVIVASHHFMPLLLLITTYVLQGNPFQFYVFITALKSSSNRKTVAISDISNKIKLAPKAPKALFYQTISISGLFFSFFSEKN